MDRLSPAQLGADDVIRFTNIRHFLSELEGPLGRGQALVRTRRNFEAGEELVIQFEAPGVSWRVSADVRVEALARGRVGFEVLDFEGAVRPRLDALAAEARGLLPSTSMGEAQVAFDDSDEPPTGQIERPPALQAAAEEEEAPQRLPPPLSRAATPLPEMVAGDDMFSEAGFDEDPSDDVDEITRLASVTPEDPAQTLGVAVPAARESTVAESGPPVVPKTAPVSAPAPELNSIREAAHAATRDELVAARARIASLEQALEAAEAESIESEAVQTATEEQLTASKEQVASVSEQLAASNEQLAAAQAQLEAATQAQLEAAAGTEAAATAEPSTDAQALGSSHAALAKATASGVLKLTDPVDLLGLYLSQIRHGRITVLGGPEGEVGSQHQLKIAGATVTTLAASIVARAGPWTTLQLEEPELLQPVLRDGSDSWRPTLDMLAPPAEPVAVITPAPPAADEPAATPEPPAQPPVTAEPVVAESSEPAPDAGTPPRLKGSNVVFSSISVLASEMEKNLANGGLFVDSAPLPRRERRSLEVVVGDSRWGVQLQADVVFADGGKVGFSVSNATDALKNLRALVAEGGPSGTADLTPDLAPSQQRTADLQVHMGSIGDPPQAAQLITLQSTRIEDLKHGEPLAVVQLTEAIVRRGWRGVISIESDKSVLRAWFHEGSIAFVDQKPADDETYVGRILVQQKKINDGTIRDALKKAKASKRPLGRMLVSLGHVRKGEMVAALREQTRLRMESAFAARTGKWQWSPWTDPPGSADVILTRGSSVLARHVRNALDHMNVSEIEALFGSNVTRAVKHSDSFDELTQGLGLQPKELRFLELSIDGDRSIHDASLGSPIGKLASLRLVGVCLAIGVVEYSDGRGAQLQSRGASDISDRRFKALEQDLKDRLQLMAQQNHFEVLGVHWSAHHRNYREAFETATKKLDTRKAPLRDAPPPVKDLARQAAGLLTRSFEALKDEGSRSRYRKEMFDKTEREYAADMLVKQGEVALMRNDRVEAIELLETAVELNPSQRNRTLLQTAREGRR